VQLGQPSQIENSVAVFGHAARGIDLHAQRNERIVSRTERSQAVAPCPRIDLPQTREHAFPEEAIEMCLGGARRLVVCKSQQQLSVVPDSCGLCKNDGMSGGILRRTLFPLPLILSACARRKAPALPETAAGGWRLQETKREHSRIMGTYQGPGTVRVEIEDTGSSGTALDRAQRTRAQPDTVFFYKGDYFVTVKWEQADRDALKLLVRDLEKRLE
jgi:hypothetical protein